MIPIDAVNAPQEHGAATILPQPQKVVQSVRHNVELFRNYCFDIAGQQFTELQTLARSELVAAAKQFTGKYRSVSSRLDRELKDGVQQPIVLAGHQPQLFHPGVWFKNFALAKTARQIDGLPINLIIDNDAVNAASLRVPTGTVEQPFVDSVPFDTKPAADLPFEEWNIDDRQQFNSFASNVKSSIRQLVPHPLIEEFWPLVVAAAERTSNIGQCFAEARHQFELQQGIETLEVPLSKIADGDAFQTFASSVFADHQRFHQLYNEELLKYRKEFRVRSATHPAPLLERVDDWWELPFWVWSSAVPQRRKLFVRCRGDVLELTDQAGWIERRDRRGREIGKLGRDRDEGDLGRVAKIRPRALITTMYVRLFLGDGFLHGIGGAKYDRLTDRIIAGYWGVEPPKYAVISATFHLPTGGHKTSLADLRHAIHKLRALRFHPEDYVDSSEPALGRMIAEKRKWVAMKLSHGQRKQRHDSIAAVNAGLFSELQKERAELKNYITETSNALRLQAILESREYSFCLHPRETLFPLLLELFDFDP